MPEYSPSVFSRIRTVSTLSYGVLKPATERQGRRLAKRLNVRRRVRLRETWPLPMGVCEYGQYLSMLPWTSRPPLTARGPFRAILFFLMLSIAASGIAVLPSLRIGVTSQGSQAMGVYHKSAIGSYGKGFVELLLALAAAKMSFTACEISGPIPSPSIRDTVYLPCQAVSTSLLHPPKPQCAPIELCCCSKALPLEPEDQKSLYGSVGVLTFEAFCPVNLATRSCCAAAYPLRLCWKFLSTCRPLQHRTPIVLLTCNM